MDDKASHKEENQVKLILESHVEYHDILNHAL